MRNKRNAEVFLIYKKLYKTLGPRHWWPGETPFEIMVGAILTQNTAWKNVEKAIKNIKIKKMLTPRKLQKLSAEKLGSLIKPAGFYNVKAKRLKNFFRFFRKYNYNVKQIKKIRLPELRDELLAINGVGRETADSILLYALQKPIFVVDAYTKRIFLRHKIIKTDIGYNLLQKLFMDNLPKNHKLFNEYHALIVEAGKRFCKPRRPLCGICPLNGI